MDCYVFGAWSPTNIGHHLYRPDGGAAYAAAKKGEET